MVPEAHQRHETYEVTQALNRLQSAFERFGQDKLPYELLEAIAETTREQFGDTLKQEDDGSMPWEVQELITLLQRFEEMRR